MLRIAPRSHQNRKSHQQQFCKWKEKKIKKKRSEIATTIATTERTLKICTQWLTHIASTRTHKLNWTELEHTHKKLKRINREKRWPKCIRNVISTCCGDAVWCCRKRRNRTEYSTGAAVTAHRIESSTRSRIVKQRQNECVRVRAPNAFIVPFVDGVWYRRKRYESLKRNRLLARGVLLECETALCVGRKA